MEYEPGKTTPVEIVEIFNSQTFFRASLPAGETSTASSDAPDQGTAASLTGPAGQVALWRPNAGLLYSAYVLFGLVIVGLGALTWRVVRKGTHVGEGISTE